MEISELTLKLIILLIPGAIACIIFEKLTIHKKWNPFQFISGSILFGGLSYLPAQTTLDTWIKGHHLDNFWQNLPSKDIEFNGVLEGIVAAIFVGLICAGLDNYKIINKVGKKLRLTSKYGDENLYSYFLNAKNITEVYVRDMEKNITYHGLIDSFSETEEFKELVLRDVKVYDYETSTLRYELDKIYLSKPKDNIIIEIPFILKQQNDDGKAKASVKAAK